MQSRCSYRRDLGLRIRVFPRPFPFEEIAKQYSLKRVAVLDENISLGAKAVQPLSRSRDIGSTIPVKGYVLGLGGRDIPGRRILKKSLHCAREGIGDPHGLRKEMI